MNNCVAKLCEVFSKNKNKTYYYIQFTIENIEVGKLWIKETEVDYYKRILKKG